MHISSVRWWQWLVCWCCGWLPILTPSWLGSQSCLALLAAPFLSFVSVLCLYHPTPQHLTHDGIVCVHSDSCHRPDPQCWTSTHGYFIDDLIQHHQCLWPTPCHSHSKSGPWQAIYGAKVVHWCVLSRILCIARIAQDPNDSKLNFQNLAFYYIFKQHLSSHHSFVCLCVWGGGIKLDLLGYVSSYYSGFVEHAPSCIWWCVGSRISIAMSRKEILCRRQGQQCLDRWR